MKEKNSWIVWLIALVAVVALIVAIVALGKISTTGEAINWNRPQNTAPIKADSCDADSVCETNVLAGNSGPLRIVDEALFQKSVEFELPMNNSFKIYSDPYYSAYPVFKIDGANAIYAKGEFVSDIQVDNSGTNNQSNPGSQFVISSTTSSNPEVIYPLLIQRGHISSDAELFNIYLKNNGVFRISSDINNSIVLSVDKTEIKSALLVGSGNAYLCVNSVGRFYRSLTPCV